ncbi:tRNA adenosine deaminase-associated protein [Corynebacterium timonense]|uniref:Putative tRNA adenosine deaminase-associated protein n=1 Tax=Corynebacterium timonense TaxID=441500 RepID=A0A1H1TST0_9CORY|nr:tRNA adenosine deaminase-associated protein [Corynebacterium timonense]SDS62986.1 putative tRNA adenosine deaminase-associated protein [Corynebacterium timonense]
MSLDYEDGFAVTVASRDGRWEVREFEDDFASLSTSIDAVRALRSEGAAFAILNVEEDYFVVVRPGPSRTRLLISDATMAVDDDFAADVLDEAGIDIPDIAPETLDDIDGWADGDFDIFADLGLSEQVLSILLDGDDDPSVAIERIAEEIGFADELDECLG